MKTIYLHIGLVKTGTTFLQHHIFPYLEKTAYIKNRSLNSEILTSESIQYLVSSETMSGNPFATQKKGEIGYFEQFKNGIENILEIYNHPKVIVSFREPSTFINSCYKQYLHQGGTLQFSEFFSIENKKSLMKPEDFTFSKFVKFLVSKFDRDDLFIYDFSDFLTDKELLVLSIAEFLNDKLVLQSKLSDQKKANPSVPDIYESTLRRLNRGSKSFFNKTGYRLQLSAMGKTVNPRVICQYVLPRIYSKPNQRNLDTLKKYYESDWQMCLKLINKIQA